MPGLQGDDGDDDDDDDVDVVDVKLTNDPYLISIAIDVGVHSWW